MRIYTHAERQPGAGITVPQYTPDPWDAFVEQDAIFRAYWEKAQQTFPQYTFYICDDDDRLMASATAVPLYFTGDQLPDGGWRWALEAALLRADPLAPNLVSALGIHVVPAHRGEGLSKLALNLLRKTTREQGITQMVAPVRPSEKHRYPLIPMDDYMTWTRQDGQLFDAWMRVHQQAGAEVVRVAPESMIVKGTVAEWEKWTGQAFPGSGQHIVPGALVPVSIDREANQGVYVEPNVWMRHPL